MRIRKRCLQFAVALLTLGSAAQTVNCFAANDNAADLYVSPVGNDAWSGRLPTVNSGGTDGPLATLQRARDAVRELATRRKGDVTVLIRDGVYQLDETVVFSRDDSAPDNSTITYAAYPGEHPVFTSAKLVTGWRKLDTPPRQLAPEAHGKVWVADVSTRSPFYTLFEGNRKLPRARGPGFSPRNSTPRGSKEYQTVEFPLGAVQDAGNWTGMELRIVPSHYWIMNLLPVASIDEATGFLKTAVPGTYPLGRNGMTDRDNAWIENSLRVLDEPGEWALNPSTGLLYLWPAAGQPGPDVAIPTLTELIRVEGQIDYEGPQDTPVQGLVFRGLTFSQADRYPWHGRTGWGLQHDWECFDRPTGLVRFRGAQRCAVEGCEFRDSGHTALRLDLHCQEIRIVDNHMHHVGGVGILLAGYGPGTKDVNRRNEVVNNYIHDIGLEYWASAAIFAWQSGENRIAHNHITHVPYTGIVTTGRISRTLPGPGECSRTIRWHETPEAYRQWDWRRREPYLHARRNVIEYNEIHNAMQLLGDGNCIYVSGAGGGNIVRYNYCHDCDGQYMNAVIRCDDDQHDTTLHGNICCRTGGFGEGFISKGDNDITNNIVADLRPVDRHRGYIVFPYGEIKGSTIERNILYSCREGQILYHENAATSRPGSPPRLRDTQTDYNLYWCSADDHWASAHLKSQRAVGNEVHSVQADPLFVDLEGGDFGFRPGSPALTLGIEPLDASKAGLLPPAHKRLIGRSIRTWITPGDQILHDPLTVTMRTDDPQAEIHYTLDGTSPSKDSPCYRGPFELDHPATVRARAFADGATDLLGARACFASPPAPIVEDFESVRVGGLTPLASTSEDAQLKQYSARVSDQEASDGEHSLKFTDGPNQKHTYTPHIFYRCQFTGGRMVGRFDVLVDEATSFSYQWRQYDDTYCQGPSVTILPGGIVTHGNRQLMKVPTGRWVHCEVHCELGDPSRSDFELRIRLPDEAAPHVFESLSQDARFQRLDWVGFIARAERVSTCYIDNIEVRPEE